jgi:hypothetical protein
MFYEQKRAQTIIQYMANPKHCIECGNPLPFDKDVHRKNFCNRSCAASYTNKHREVKERHYSEIGLKNLRLSARQNFLSEDIIQAKIEYEKHPNLCINCGAAIKFAKRNQDKCCSWKCKKEYFGNNLEPYNVYKSLAAFKFGTSTYDEFNSDLIRKFGWYQAANRGNNLNGVSRDHMLSVKVGYKQMINPLLLAHPANCELMQQNDNSSKWKKCSLSVEELLSRILTFDAKYGTYYTTQLKTHITIDELNDLYLQTPTNNRGIMSQ